MFGDLLKELRAQKKVSQIELARAIGVSNGNVGDWERGRSKPGYDALVALSRYFEISAGRLLELPISSGELTCDDVPLTQMESDVIAMLRLLNPHDRKNAVDFITMLYEQATGKKGSIYATYIEDEYRQTSGPAEGGSQSVIA